MKGKKILLVDDVISTGESMAALEALVAKAGGEICGRAAILAEGDAQERPDIVYLESCPCSTPTEPLWSNQNPTAFICRGIFAPYSLFPAPVGRLVPPLSRIPENTHAPL